MDTDSKLDKTRQTTAHDDDTQGSSFILLDDIQSLSHELLGLIQDRFRLAALETRRAGESLVVMVVAGVLIAVLLNSAWLGLVTTAVLGLVENGVVVINAILFAVAFNLLFALILCGVIRRKCRYLQFPATLRSFETRHRKQRNTEKHDVGQS